MNILDYLDEYGSKPFSEKPFGDVDALILAQLSYVNFDLIAPSIDEPDKPAFYIRNLPMSLVKKLANGELTTPKNESLLVKLKSSLRFKDVGILYVKKEASITVEQQFFAVTFILPNKEHYISYRGTDMTLVGWKEDLNMGFMEVVPAQNSAIEYLNKVTSLFKGNYYIGGHSKGGNLSFFAALNQDKWHIKRCLKAYSFDGPGFCNRDLFSGERYELVKPKLIKIVPENCTVGIILHNIDNFQTVKSSSISVLQHDPYTWRLNKTTGEFKFINRRSKSSFINEKGMSMWIDSLNKEETILIIKVIFDYLGGVENNLATLVAELPRTIVNLYKVNCEFSVEEKSKVISIVKRLTHYHKRAREYYNSKEGRLELAQLKKEKENA